MSTAKLIDFSEICQKKIVQSQRYLKTKDSQVILQTGQ